MHTFNKALWFLFLISSSLLLTLAQEYNEDLPDLRLEGSDTYNDGTIILLFAQKDNETKKYINAKIHLRIVFVNRTILPVEIDYSSYPNFIYECDPTNLMLCTLTPKALIEKYVLIESKDNNGNPYKEMIVSWDGIIHGMYDLNKYEVTVDINSMQKFFITELYNNTTLIQRRFTVQNPNNLNTSLKEEKITYNGFKDNTIIYFYTTFSLVEGGYATIIFREIKSNKPNNKTIREIYVIYLKDDDFTSYQQYLLYSSISGNTLRSVEGGCKNSFDGSGYTLDFIEDLTKEQGLTYNSFRIHFSSNGAVTFIDTNNFDVLYINPVAPLFYGGYLEYNFTNSVLTVYNDDKSINKVLNLTLNSVGVNGIKPFIMQKQSSIWSIDYNNKIWNINYYPLGSIDVADSRYIYQNPSIGGTYPSINENFQIPSTIKKPFDFIINYNKPITLSSGNIAIYQYLDNNDIVLRQMISGQSELCQLFNETAISVKIFASALHQKNVKYGVRVENNFAKSKYNEEALLGISERIWTFNTFLEAPEKPADQVTFTARLKFDNGNINFYNKINSKNSLIIQQLKDELVQAIPIDQKRLIINKKVQNENTDDENQVLISATIMPPDTNNDIERNTDSVLKDLNELIQQKKYNLILRGNITKFFDENYGVQILPDFWARYKVILIVLVIGIVIVGCLILIANYKDEKGKNFSIVKIIIIIYDLVLDVAFVAKNANDVPNLFVFSLCSVIIPIIFNMAVVIYSLIQEIIYNQDFNKWCKKNSFIISIFTILSSTDVEALHILSSKIAGLNAFSAPPLSTKISKLVFWAGCINIFLENIPQFIIQVYYHKSIIVYTIIPSLSLISSSIILSVSSIGKIYFFFMYLYKNNNFNRRISQQLGDVKM